MASTPDIQIRIDEGALKAQIKGALEEAFHQFASRLRFAADEIDGGEFTRFLESQRAESFEAGRASVLGGEE